MSFTFDDIPGPLPVSTSVKMEQLSAKMEQLSSRIAALQARGEADSELSAKIARLEKRRQQLFDKAARGFKPIELEGRGAEDGVGEGHAGDAAKSRLKVDLKGIRQMGIRGIGLGRR